MLWIFKEEFNLLELNMVELIHLINSKVAPDKLPRI
jgi:hypothetical protein